MHTKIRIDSEAFQKERDRIRVLKNCWSDAELQSLAGISKTPFLEALEEEEMTPKTKWKLEDAGLITKRFIIS